MRPEAEGRSPWGFRVGAPKARGEGPEGRSEPAGRSPKRRCLQVKKRVKEWLRAVENSRKALIFIVFF